jgi:hypothetical protein
VQQGTKVVNVLGVHVPVEVIEVLNNFSFVDVVVVALLQTLHQLVGSSAHSILVRCVWQQVKSVFNFIKLCFFVNFLSVDVLQKRKHFLILVIKLELRPIVRHDVVSIVCMDLRPAIRYKIVAEDIAFKQGA